MGGRKSDGSFTVCLWSLGQQKIRTILKRDSKSSSRRQLGNVQVLDFASRPLQRGLLARLAHIETFRVYELDIGYAE